MKHIRYKVVKGNYYGSVLKAFIKSKEEILALVSPFPNMDTKNFAQYIQENKLGDLFKVSYNKQTIEYILNGHILYLIDNYST